MNIGNCGRKYQCQNPPAWPFTMSTSERLPASMITPSRLRIIGTS
jgi:hypothetical protein